MKKVAIYLRVSTDSQTTGNQRRELEAVAARSGWQILKTYEDAGISGAKGRDKRPGGRHDEGSERQGIPDGRCLVGGPIGKVAHGSSSNPAGASRQGSGFVSASAGPGHF